MHKMHNFLEVDFLSDFDTPIFLKVDFFSDFNTSIFLKVILVIHSYIWRINEKGCLSDWIVGGYAARKHKTSSFYIYSVATQAFPLQHAAWIHKTSSSK